MSCRRNAGCRRTDWTPDGIEHHCWDTVSTTLEHPTKTLTRQQSRAATR